MEFQLWNSLAAFPYNLRRCLLRGMLIFMNNGKDVKISVVVPCHNEEGSVLLLYNELRDTLSSQPDSYELIFVDDGSIDKSLEILKRFKIGNDHVRVFSFRKNQGKAEALTFGFQRAKGDYIVTLDADLQDRPTEIPKLLEKAKKGWDVVCGWRENRQDPFLKMHFVKSL